jgi:hypothetical protein
VEARGWDQFFEAVEIELPEVVIAEGRMIDLWGLEEAQSWANFAAVYWHGPIDPDSEESKMFATWFGSLIIHCMTTESQCRYEDAEGNKYIRAPWHRRAIRDHTDIVAALVVDGRPDA